jgi:hypothetical protein
MWGLSALTPEFIAFGILFTLLEHALFENKTVYLLYLSTKCLRSWHF